MRIIKIGTRIRELRLAKDRELKDRRDGKFDQTDLAGALGLTPQAIQKWEDGKSNPRPNKLQALAEALNTNIQSLIRGTDVEDLFASLPQTPSQNGKFASPVHEINVQPVRADTEIPLLSWEQAGAWGQIVSNFQRGDAESWSRVPFAHGARAFCLKVVGDSMYNPGDDRSYGAGEFIAVDPDREAVNRSMVVVKLPDGDKATFKQLIVDPDGTRMLKALNPDWPKQFIEIDEHAEIIGVVIGKWTPEPE